MSFNAVLRKANAEVFGKVSLTTLETLPKAWEVTLGEKFISKNTDFKTLLCDNKFPLSVHTVPVKREIRVKLKSEYKEVDFECTLSLRRELTTVPCGACTGKFPPAKFVVCDGKALFRYKKSDKPLEIHSKVVESFGGIKKFADDGTEVAEYDCIEVTTVKKDESFHVCCRCDMPIRMKVDGGLYDCGHPFHLACKEDQCGICNAQDIPDEEFNALVDYRPGSELVIQGKRKRTQRVL
ncbi:hypothetical protein Ocin01_15934 [Orchesella cincta]|uniref:Uncharacterized protein n=1 Tax=Orchesella cincta TaxID=48709 RepID=A0A1D2MCS6_ORCCI|nr:hypothetical protein Ocin01_15934 [Orchesella cincta]